MKIRDIVKRYSGKAGTLLFMVAIVFFLSGCLDNDQSNVEPIARGYVSIYHAAPDAPGVDIIVDNRQINSQPFDYTDYSGYLNFFTGTRNLKFNSVNASSSLIDTTFNVEDGKAYSLFLINGATRLEALVVTDSTAAPQAGKAMVRFVHLSPDAAALDVLDNETELFSNTAFRQATDFKEVDAKTYSFRIRTKDSGEVLLSVDDIVFQSGGYYTIITRGFDNPPAGNQNVLSLEVL